jgi:hypothetical protein
MTIAEAVATEQREQSRARYPDEEGFIERDGVRVFWESYGEGPTTILFLPTWTLVTRACGRRRSPTSPVTSACSASTHAGTAARIAA